MKRRSLAIWFWSVTAVLLALVLIMEIAWYATVADIKQDKAFAEAQRVVYRVKTGDYVGESRALHKPSDAIGDASKNNAIGDASKDNAAGDAPKDNAAGDGPVKDGAPMPLAPTPGEGAAAEDPKQGKPIIVHEQEVAAAGTHGEQDKAEPAAKHQDVIPQGTPATDARASEPAPEGMPRWRKYARSDFKNPEQLPTVTIVMVGMGLSATNTDQAMEVLPEEVALSFSPYPKTIEEWTQKAHQKGFEVFLDVPMEPETYPMADAGPYALMTSQTGDELKASLKWMSERTPTFLGFVSPVQEKFTDLTDSTAMALEYLKNYDILFVRAKPQVSEPFRKALAMTGVPALSANLVIDQVISAAEIESALNQLVEQAKKDTMSVGIAHPYPVTVKILKKWEGEWKKKGVILAPVSALVQP